MGKATEARGSRLGRQAKLLALAQFPLCGRAKRRRERMENPRYQVLSGLSHLCRRGMCHFNSGAGTQIGRRARHNPSGRFFTLRRTQQPCGYSNCQATRYPRTKSTIVTISWPCVSVELDPGQHVMHAPRNTPSCVVHDLATSSMGLADLRA